MCKSLSKFADVTGVHTYEKLTFEGHQALKLLAQEGGKMAVTNILELMWPTGDADDEGGRQYVPRVTALWAQWSKVVHIMKERDPEKVRGEQGFARFGKECREFCRLYQAMYHEQHCRSFYLHVLMHHAGDFMRELEREGMCLGMMSNSGVERRHEYGRRAAKKALAGGCWKSKSAALAGKANLFAYLTLKEVLIWQCGTDIVSHNTALKAYEKPASDRHVADGEAAAYLAATMDDAKRAMEDAEMSDAPVSTTELQADGTEVEGCDETARIRELFIGRDELCGVLEQESVAGSDEFEDEDAEEMARRIRDLEDLRGDWLQDEEEDDCDFDGPADDDSEDDGPEDKTWVNPGPRRKPDLSIALSRGRRRSALQGAGRTEPATSACAAQPQPAAASLPAGFGQEQAVSDPPEVPRNSASLRDWEKLEKLKVKELKELCKESGIPVSGSKIDLITRLAQYRPAA